jgi:hypothetical protein
MSTIKSKKIMFVLLCISILSCGLTANVVQTPEAEKEEFLKDMSSITTIRRSLSPDLGIDKESFQKDPEGYIKQIMALRDKNDLNAYEQFADAILNKWASQNAEYFGRLTLALCAELGGGTFEDDRCYELRRQYALLALEKGSALSVETELELTGLVTPYAPKREDFALRRKKDIDVRLRAWRRLLVAIDPTWDPDEVVGVYPDPPRGLQYWVNGMDPNAIGDPIIRAEYKAALAAKQQKIEEYVEQNRLHKWLERYPKYIESYMISNYSRPPYNSEELKQMLDASALGEERQTHILETVTRNIEAAKADDPNDITNVLRGECNDISNVLPEAFIAYRQQLTGKDDIQDCNALFVLIAKAKVMRDEPLEDAKAKEARNLAYCSAWRLALHMRQHSKFPAVQKRILEEWNKALRQDDEAAPYQIYALSGVLWNREFLTEDFWALLQQTHRKKTISAFCFVLHYRGNDADIKHLEQKLQSGIDVEMQQVIQNAFNWRKYRLGGDKTRGMPAARPPFREMKEETINQVEKTKDQEHLPQLIPMPR